MKRAGLHIETPSLMLDATAVLDVTAHHVFRRPAQFLPISRCGAGCACAIWSSNQGVAIGTDLQILHQGWYMGV